MTPATTATLVKVSRAEQWADRIRTQLGKSVEAIVEVGRLLVKAKANLPHGEWGRLFADELVPFGQITAARLMAIANNPVLSNLAHGPNLPTSWRTLYELTKADRAKLKTALKDGVITPETQRRDVKAFLPPKKKTSRRKVQQKKGSVTGYRTAGSRLYFQIARLLSDEFERLSADDQDELLSMLDQTLTELRANRVMKAEQP